MGDSTIVEVAKVAVPSLTTLGALWLGVSLNRRNTRASAIALVDIDRHKYAQDRLWDAKRETYSNLLATIGKMKRIASSIRDGFYGEFWHPEEYFQSDVYTANSERLWTLWRTLLDDFDSSHIILSDNFIERFQLLSNQIGGSEDDSPPERAHDTYVALDVGSRELMVIARAEIAPPIVA